MKTENLGYVKGLGYVYRSYANFAQQLRDFNEDGIKAPINVRDASYIRLHSDNRESTRTCHAPVCAVDSPTIVVRMSPLIKDLEMAEIAVNAHKHNEYPVFDNNKSIYAKYEKIAKADKNKSPEKRKAIILPGREDYSIHRDSQEARFFWQDTRKEYFDKSVSGDSVPCLQIPTNKVDSADGTIINYLWFSRPDYGSDLYFGDWDLDDGDRALGVFRKSAKGTSQKILPYTERQQREYIKILDDVMAGEVETSKLEKVAQFFRQK